MRLKNYPLSYYLVDVKVKKIYFFMQGLKYGLWAMQNLIFSLKNNNLLPPPKTDALQLIQLLN